MPGHTSKPGAESPTPPEAGITPEDFLDDTDDELAADHVVRRFFATHERDLRPDLRPATRTGVKRQHGDEGGRTHPRPNLRRRRPGIPEDEG